MKTIILNGSPRKNWNTALMLKEAGKGAESVGAETEYIDLFDLSYTGCRSCMACKRKGGARCRCYWKDDLSPLIDPIFAADALIIGSPIYLGDVTSQVHGIIERLHFCALSYDDYFNYFTGKINVGIILTMNAPKAYYNMAYKKKAKEIAQSFKALNGEVEVLPCCDTLQVTDSYAVAALQAGDDIKTVQGNLGHATAAFTLDVYGHVTDQMKEDSANRMERFIHSVRTA